MTLTTKQQNKLLDEFRRLQNKRAKIPSLKNFSSREKAILVLEITKRMNQIERKLEEGM